MREVVCNSIPVYLCHRMQCGIAFIWTPSSLQKQMIIVKVQRSKVVSLAFSGPAAALTFLRRPKNSTWRWG